MQVIWDGDMCAPFNLERDICQGDLVSLYIFTIYMERLLQFILKEIDEGKWKPITYGEVKLSHLFFVDDLILSKEATTQ